MPATLLDTSRLHESIARLRPLQQGDLVAIGVLRESIHLLRVAQHAHACATTRMAAVDECRHATEAEWQTAARLLRTTGRILSEAQERCRPYMDAWTFWCGTHRMPGVEDHRTGMTLSLERGLNGKIVAVETLPVWTARAQTAVPIIHRRRG